jgi:hypothetical protein
MRHLLGLPEQRGDPSRPSSMRVQSPFVAFTATCFISPHTANQAAHTHHSHRATIAPICDTALPLSTLSGPSATLTTTAGTASGRPVPCLDHLNSGVHNKPLVLTKPNRGARRPAIDRLRSTAAGRCAAHWSPPGSRLNLSVPDNSSAPPWRPLARPQDGALNVFLRYFLAPTSAARCTSVVQPTSRRTERLGSSNLRPQATLEDRLSPTGAPPQRPLPASVFLRPLLDPLRPRLPTPRTLDVRTYRHTPRRRSDRSRRCMSDWGCIARSSTHHMFRRTAH